jgi:hypothetical protein
MKRILFLLAVLFLYGSSTFAQGWEGTLEMSMKVPQLGDDPIPMTMNIKGNKVHAVMTLGAMGAMETYIDNDKKKLVQVMKAMNMGTEIDLSQMENKPAGESKENPKPVATGKKEVINGFKCDEYTCKVDDIDMEMWMTKDIPAAMTGSIQSAMGGVSRASGANASAFEELAKDGNIAIRTVFKQNGAVQLQTEIVKYESKTFPDSEFIVPSNITIQKMDPSMMGGAGQ